MLIAMRLRPNRILPAAIGKEYHALHGRSGPSGGHLGDGVAPAVDLFNRENVVIGGLASYSVNIAENFRRSAIYIDKIFKGAAPGPLVIEFPTKLLLVRQSQDRHHRAAIALGPRRRGDRIARSQQQTHFVW